MKILALVMVGSVAALAEDKTEAQRLQDGEIIVTTQKVEGSTMPQATVRAVIDAPPDVVWPILIDCANYKNTMPRIIESDAVSKTGDVKNGVTHCKVTADMPFPLADLVSTTEATHKVEGTHYERTWKLIKGDYKTVTGAWVLDPLDDGKKTMATYRIHAEPKLALPDAILSAAQTGALPKVIAKLREQTAAKK